METGVSGFTRSRYRAPRRFRSRSSMGTLPSERKSRILTAAAESRCMQLLR